MVNEYRAGDVASAPWMAQRPNPRQDGVLREERHLHGTAYFDNPDAFDSYLTGDLISGACRTPELVLVRR